MDPGKLVAAGLTALIGGWLVWLGLRRLSGTGRGQVVLLGVLRGAVVSVLALAAVGPTWVR
ncbi:MAG: hypothetical protein N2512_02835, partial [Armatimonadetes bacterium]|nr:hypothetical protein [Armatimonadota bacterium]